MSSTAISWPVSSTAMGYMYLSNNKLYPLKFKLLNEIESSNKIVISQVVIN